jgi:hypothetical protein
VGNDETKTQLEEAAFLSLVADIYYHDISRVSSACCAAASDHADTGAIHSGEKTQKTHQVIRHLSHLAYGIAWHLVIL